MDKKYHFRISIFSIVLLAFISVNPLSAKGFTNSLQATLTTGKNNGFDETYTGIWLNTKKNIGLSRNSLLSLKGKIGGKAYQYKNYNYKTSTNVTDLILSANYLYQPSSGFFSPLYSAKLQFKQETFSNISSNADTTSLSLIRSQPLNSRINLAYGLNMKQEKGINNVDSQSLIFNIDYNHSLKNLYYFNLNVSNKDSNIGYNPNNTPSNNYVYNPNNSSISFGTIYSLSNKHSFDIGYIKHFYKVSNKSSNSSYFAIDYFYHF